MALRSSHGKDRLQLQILVNEDPAMKKANPLRTQWAQTSPIQMASLFFALRLRVGQLLTVVMVLACAAAAVEADASHLLGPVAKRGLDKMELSQLTLATAGKDNPGNGQGQVQRAPEPHHQESENVSTIESESGNDESTEDSTNHQGSHSPTDSSSDESKGKDKAVRTPAVTESQKAEEQGQQALHDARSDAENAPQQPFWNPWLLLVAFALVMILLSYVPTSFWNRTRQRGSEEELIASSEATPRLAGVQRVAFRFIAVYFCLFFFPVSNVLDPVTNWAAINVFGLSAEWVPYSGSGDSTESYVRLFCVFVLAVILSTAWSLLDRRRTDYRICRDLFHSIISYTLAMTMMYYGLAKLGNAGNQFPLVSGATLDSTWGDTSPMGALWKFMGTSRAYTMFGGLGELVGALLLIFRRTRTLGALVTFGVMVNVVMLNFCYDVPVKINSSHLALLAFCIAMRDWDRLSGILLFNQNTTSVELNPPYTGPRTIWVHRAVKLVVVVLLFGFTIYGHLVSEIQFANRPAEPEFYGSYAVTQFETGDQQLAEGDPHRWKGISLRLRPRNINGEPGFSNWLAIRREDDSFKAHSFEFDAEDKLLLGKSVGMSFFVPSELAMHKNDAGDWILTGETETGEMIVTLRPIDASKSRLMGRGFRWINEVPFSR